MILLFSCKNIAKNYTNCFRCESNRVIKVEIADEAVTISADRTVERNLGDITVFQCLKDKLLCFEIHSGMSLVLIFDMSENAFMNNVLDCSFFKLFCLGVQHPAFPDLVALMSVDGLMCWINLNDKNMTQGNFPNFTVILAFSGKDHKLASGCGH